MIDSHNIFKDKQVALLADAVRKGDSKTIKTLVDKGVNPNTVGENDISLLLWAIHNDNPKGFTALLNSGADPTICNSDGKTLLHLAAVTPNIIFLKILLKHGIDLNTISCRSGSTAIFDAIEEMHFNLLLDAGTDLSIKNNVGNTILHSTSQNHIINLLKAGANPKARNNLGNTFQTTFFMKPERILTKEARENRKWVKNWLKNKNILVEGGD